MSAVRASPRRRIGAWLRALSSLLLLAGILAWIRPASLLATVDTVSVAWLGVALLLGVAQVLLSAGSRERHLGCGDADEAHPA